MLQVETMSLLPAVQVEKLLSDASRRYVDAALASAPITLIIERIESDDSYLNANPSILFFPCCCC